MTAKNKKITVIFRGDIPVHMKALELLNRYKRYSGLSYTQAVTNFIFAGSEKLPGVETEAGLPAERGKEPRKKGAVAGDSGLEAGLPAEGIEESGKREAAAGDSALEAGATGEGGLELLMDKIPEDFMEKF